MGWIDGQIAYYLVMQILILILRNGKILTNHKRHHVANGKRKSVISNRRSNSNRGENLKNHPRGRLALAIAIC